jgi:hypothetical protein
MDNRAGGVQYAIVLCSKCGRELAVNIENANEPATCADCDRIRYSYLVTEDVLPIEYDCD